MSNDFIDAAQRHWNDAEHLAAAMRWPNADQLYAFTAECALKAVMAGLGMKVRPDGSPERPYRIHIDKLWSEFHTLANGTGASTYAAMLAGQNPFHDWSVDQRYWHSSSVTAVQAQLHRRGAETAKQVLNQARIDGRVS